MRGVRLLKGDETERKTEGVAKQDGGIFFGKLSGSFQVNVTLFLPFSPVSLTELCSFWYDLKDLFTLPK